MNKRNSLLAIALTLVLGLAALRSTPAHAQTRIGQPAPVATFMSAGKAIPLTTYRGHKTMVWLFSTWCPSCSAGLAALAKEQAALKAGGVQVVVLENYQNGGYTGPSMAQLMTQRAGAVKSARNWIVGAATQQLASVYNPKNYPDIYYLIGADGKITDIGSAPSASMQKILAFAQK